MKVSIYGLAFFVLLLGACGSGGETPVLPDKPSSERIPIGLQCEAENGTGVTDGAFGNGDKIGLYVVPYEGNAPGVLRHEGNLVDNMCFTYNGSSWTPDKEPYWFDNSTKADFYCYYPYSASSGIARNFAVHEDQTTEQHYKASDFLWGNAQGVSPTNKAVNILMHHLLSSVVIHVEPGVEVDVDGWDATKVSVRMNGLKTEAVIDLRSGQVIAKGTPKCILPLKMSKGYDYKAIVVPQGVDSDELVTITVDGKDYNLKQGMTFEAGMQHTLTVTINRVNNGVNVSVGAWEDDKVDHGGNAE